MTHMNTHQHSYLKRRTPQHLRLGLIWVMLLMMVSCSGGADEGQGIHVKTDFKESSYMGGLVKAWVGLKGQGLVIGQEELINWKVGKGRISQRTTVVDPVDSISILSDTIWFEWNLAPPLTLDTSMVDSINTTPDSLYLDSVAVDVDGNHSEWMIFNIQNILPELDSLYLGGVISGIRDSIIKLYGHPGQMVEFSVTTKDAFVEDLSPRFEFEDVPGLRQIASDSGYTFRWQAPDSIVDDVFDFKVRDESYSGSRVYQMRMITYKETGSVWVGASDDLIKVSSTGSEIFRIQGQFQEISDIAVNPNRIYIWVIDRGTNSLYRFSNAGELIYSDSSNFIQPTALGIDVQSGALWVADLPNSSSGRIRKFDPTSLAEVTEVNSIADQTGPITGLTIDQFENDLMMYVAPEGDYITLVRDGVEDTTFTDLVNRPQHIAYDAQNGTAWVADSSHVILIDTLGVVQATIQGFEFISGLSAANGEVCIADARADEIIRFTSKISGNRQKGDGIVTGGFNTPADVALSYSDNACWVADSESGSVVKVDSDGNSLLRVIGMAQPKTIAVHQGIE